MRFGNKNYHQRGEDTMAQGVLPFKYEEEASSVGMTALGGLPLYLVPIRKLSKFRVDGGE